MAGVVASFAKAKRNKKKLSQQQQQQYLNYGKADIKVLPFDDRFDSGTHNLAFPRRNKLGVGSRSISIVEDEEDAEATLKPLSEEELAKIREKKIEDKKLDHVMEIWKAIVGLMVIISFAAILLLFVFSAISIHSSEV